MSKLLGTRLLSFMLAITMIVVMFAAVCVDAYAGYEDDKDLALDVVFVVDYSGSMRASDPSAVANEACTLFTNMCDPSRARVGAVLFTTEVEYTLPLTELQDEENREYALWWLDTMRYTASGDTDISLGLTAAKNLMAESGSFDGSRNPMIIFLSDGKTDRISAERQAVYEEELTQTLNELAENDVEVYTIGLTNSDQIDEAVLQRMADETGGRYYPTQTASNLDAILSEILALQIRSNILPIGEFDSDGTPVTVSIPVPNDSIYQANIIIMSGKGVSDLHLVNPDGTEVVIPSDRVLRVDSRVYTLLKIMGPQMGEWQLTLTGANEDHITINLLNSYDMALSLGVSHDNIVYGDTVDVQAFMMDPEGALEDEGVFEGATGILTITNVATGENETVEFVSKGTHMTAPYTFGASGDYRLDASVQGNGFQKSTTAWLVVNPLPLESRTNTNTKTVLMLSPILGVDLLSHRNIKLSRLFSWDQTSALTAFPLSGDWEELCTFEYDAETSTIQLTALKRGSADISFKILDDYGQNASLEVHVVAIPGWVVLAVILLLVAVAAWLGYQNKQKNRPWIGGALHISLAKTGKDSLPEIKVDLSTLNSKGAVDLWRVIELDGTFGDGYKEQLDEIKGFVKSVTFEALDEKSTKLKMVIPPLKNRIVKFRDDNGTIEVAKGIEKVLSSGREAVTVQIDEDYMFRFSFINESDNGWGETGFSSGFGGDSFNSGFGGDSFSSGFGGDSFNSGFGGDNGNDGFGSDSSFGGAFGVEDEQYSAF